MITTFKISFGEVYHRIYGLKFSLSADSDMRVEPENVIFKHISDDIPPKMKILNMVIPILMHFCSFLSN